MHLRTAIFRALPLAVLVSACGPIPVDQAETSCLRDAELAQRPRGEARIGVTAGGGGYSGASGRLDLDVSTDYLAGKDPSAVFNQCVMRRSGQMPTRSLYEHPGWRG